MATWITVSSQLHVAATDMRLLSDLFEALDVSDLPIIDSGVPVSETGLSDGDNLIMRSSVATFPTQIYAYGFNQIFGNTFASIANNIHLSLFNKLVRSDKFLFRHVIEGPVYYYRYVG